MRRLPLAAAALVAAGALTPLSPPAASAAPPAEAGRQIDYTAWDGGAEFRHGALNGARVVRGKLRLARETGSRTVGGTAYDAGRWKSPWRKPGFALTELIASWEARTPGHSLVEIRVRGRAADGRRSSWDLLGRWASRDKFVRSHTVSGQTDDLAKVNVDTWQTTSGDGLIAYQLRVDLLRKGGGTASPAVDTIGAVTSRLPAYDAVAPSRPGPARGVRLNVPRYSQMIHDGHYPQYGNGGEAWCSPTSTAMVLGYYDALPSPGSSGWVPSGHPDPWVDHTARMTYDSAYRGTGNWPFNTAYAAGQTGHGFVTRLRSLTEAEHLVAAGIPVVVSISFGPGQLSGAPISASNGHLLVIAGFTGRGDVVVNDPAAGSNAGVRRTYDRGELENVWLPTSGGLAYVITDDAHPLPASPGGNW